MLKSDQTIWVKTEVLLGTPKGRQQGTFWESDGNTLGTCQLTSPTHPHRPPPKPKRKKLSPPSTCWAFALAAWDFYFLCHHFQPGLIPPS
jgi:hypothetical protein